MQHAAPDARAARRVGMSVAITTTGWREAHASPTAASVFAAPGPVVVSATPEPAAGAGVAVGRVGGRLLVADADEPDRRPVQLTPEREVVNAGEPEGHGDARALERGHRRPAPLSGCRPMESSSERGRAPLAGVRVADLSRVLAGPYCTMVLADLGADVVKVERPEGGDETRSWGPPFAGGEAAYYLSVNRGKRSCALDLSQPEGRALALELCACADVVVENFKVGGADRLGVGYDAGRERNPRVVYCSITGFGSEREPPGRPGYDFVAQAESGLMSITGPEDGPPYKVGVALVDVLTGLHAAPRCSPG